MITKTLKINKKIIIAGVISLIAALFLASIQYNKISQAALTQNINKSATTIVIDAGHGGIDPGAIGINGKAEKEINLSISLMLRDMLILNGYKVIMTREDDISLHDEKYKKISQIKASDLKNRLKIFSKYENSITVMVHQNHYTQEKYHGAQMFYGKKNEKSKLLAQAFAESFKELLQPNNKRAIKPSTSAINILHNAKNPIVLAECGFVSNYNEAELLSDEEYQKKVAFALFWGIENYRKLAP